MQLFRAATFAEDELVQNKEMQRRATFSKHVLLHITKPRTRTALSSTKLLLQEIHFFRRATFEKQFIFLEKQDSTAPKFSGELFFSGWLVFQMSYVRTMYFFNSLVTEVHSFKQSVILFEQSSCGHSFFQTHRKFCNIRQSHLLSRFSTIKFFRGYMKQTIFDSSYYSEQLLLWEKLLWTSDIFYGCLLILPLYLQSFIL